MRIQYPGAYDHITCRGNGRRAIYSDESNRKLFLAKLYSSLDIYKVFLLSYICMTNHYHLLISTPEGNLSEFMQHLNLSYVSSYNHRHRRTGHLYEGRYKAFLIEADNYLLAVSRYIHLNPVRIKSVSKKTVERSMLMELLYRFCLVTQPEIGRLVGGIDYSAVSQARRRLRIRMEKDTHLKGRFDKILEQLNELSRVKT